MLITWRGSTLELLTQAPETRIRCPRVDSKLLHCRSRNQQGEVHCLCMVIKMCAKHIGSGASAHK